MPDSGPDVSAPVHNPGRPLRLLQAVITLVVVCLGFGLLSIPGAGAQAIDPQQASTNFDSGFKHSCAIRGGTVECWGANDFGQLGTELVDFSPAPLTVTGITDAVSVSTGLFATCVLQSQGTILCWGDNRGGELGDGTNTQRSTPGAVSGIADATAVSLGREHGCALHVDRTVSCWGLNFDGRLGDGTDIDRLTPVSVTGLTNVTQISAGDSHTCAVVSNGAVLCWGGNFEGQLGAGDIGEFSTTPVAVSGISTAVQVSASDHSCALLTGGAINCWGQNRHGQTGDGSQVDRFTPVEVDIAAATSVSAGYDVSCAVLAAGTIQCWGTNNNGETGNRSPSEEELVPTAALGVANAVGVNAASGYTCAVLADSSVECWGYNRFGQLGNDTVVDSLVPVPVGGDLLMATSSATCANNDGSISVSVSNPTDAARTYLVMFNNTTRGGTVNAGSVITQTISGLVDTTITVRVTDTTANPIRSVLDVPEVINCDPGLNGTAVASCVGGNGVITLTIDNPTATPLIYQAAFNNTRRTGLVAASSTTTQSIGGLVDTTFTVSLTNRTPDPDVVVYSEQVSVLCDSGGADALVATVSTVCVDGDGIITFSLENVAAAPVTYLVAVNNTRRSGTLPGGASTTAAVAGLADLTFVVKAYNTSPDPDVVLIDATETVNCSGELPLVADFEATCVDMVGAITVELSNESPRKRWYRVTLNNTVRSSAIEANTLGQVSFSGLAKGTFALTVTDTSSNPDLLLISEQVTLPCEPALVFTPSVACIDGNGQITVTIENNDDSRHSYFVFINNTRRAGTVDAGATVTQIMGGLVDATFSIRGIDTTRGAVTELDTTVTVVCDIPQLDGAQVGAQVRVAAERQ